MSASDGGATSQVMIKIRPEDGSIDWDAKVRQAFLEGCVQQGVRARMAEQALGESLDPGAAASLRDAAEDAARRASLAWMTIETCLQQYGELAALALERCIEEASLQVRRRSSSPPSLVRPSQDLVDRDGSALSIIERARERLAKFWGASDTSAA
jgi:hypothetical protein